MIRPSFVSFSDFIIRQDGKEKGRMPLLGKNQIVNAKVKQIISDSMAELVIAGKTVLVDTSLLTGSLSSVTRGDIIKLEVTGDGKIKVQKPVPPLTGLSDIGRAVTSIMDLISNDGAGLIKMLEPFFSNEKNDFKDIIFHFSKNSIGYDFKEISDQGIKARVLKFLSGTESTTDNPVHHLKDFSDVIQKFQVMNSHFSESGRYFIPFPIFFNGTFNLGQLLFDTGGGEKGKSQKSNRVITVSLLLKMSNIGAVRADMSVLNKDISGGIQVSDKEICDFVRKRIPDLKKGLNRHDFRVLRMECKVTEAEKLKSASLLDGVLHNGINEFNIVI